MAKKEENKKDTVKGKAASKSAKESGKVKGPKGVERGAKDESKSKAASHKTVKSASQTKAPKKSVKATSASKKADKVVKSSSETKAPKATTKSGKPAAGKAKTTTAKKSTATRKATSSKATKFKEPLTDKEVPHVAAPATKETSSPEEELPGKNKKTARTKTSSVGKTAASKKARKTEASTEKKPGTKKAPAKKMSRQKTPPGVSAEEKMKLPNTSPTDDLKDTAMEAGKDLADKLTPDEKTRKDLEKKAKDIIPDADEVKSAAAKAKDFVEEVIPDKEEISSAAKKVKKAVKRATSKTKEEQKSSEDKPVEATLLTDFDIHLFKEGKHYHLYNKLGSHLMDYMGTKGVYFAVWAPNAESVAVMGDFNNWDKDSHQMRSRWDNSGIWEVFIPEAKKGSLYKYFIRSTNGYEAEKGDPYAFSWETPPNTASMVWDLENTWNDKIWMDERSKKRGKPQPYSVYELHLGSWKRVPEDNFRSLTYLELAEELPKYLKEMNFTHVEFMPVMEHPFFGSWGYQITGYFAPSSRFGTPQDFMHLIDKLHQAGIGVLLDWVPSHFPSDLHGLHYFDGTFLYEHADPKKGFHPDWQSYIFNYGRNEIKSFLISNAVFWLDKFHADGLRVDAVASMLYLDYSRKEGEWEPNEFGGRENLEAISFLKEFNETVYKEFPDTVTIAEESTAWPMVSKPTYIGGLGFGMKWMMGWMHDTLEYFSKDPVHRRHHQNTITFSTTYAFTENFMLPLSHDEVVYGKHSILNKMPGDEWNKFANLRTLYAYMYGHPGTKLLFMGSEFGQTSEWNHDGSLEWHLTDFEPHKGIQETLKELNHLYKKEPALYEKAFSHEGFEWIDINDDENSIISFFRKGDDPKNDIMVVCNFTPMPRENYRIGIAEPGKWKEIFNSDEKRFGGSGVHNFEEVESVNIPAHQKENSLSLTLPPMGVVYLKRT